MINNVIALSATDLAIAAAGVLGLAVVTWRMGMDQGRPLLVAAVRMIVQLLLIGTILQSLFANAQVIFTFGIMAVMVLIAGYEVTARQKRRLRGWWGYGLGSVTMFVSNFSVLLLALLVLVQPTPWYEPQYAIPLFGMLLGNSMTGIALALDRLTEGAWQQRREIEARLMLGDRWEAAIAPVKREAMRSGLMPLVNGMAAAGLVSLPGMMTGQILGGSPPLEASRYQILIMLLITIASGFGTVISVKLGSRRLFDARERLALERLSAPKP